MGVKATEGIGEAIFQNDLVVVLAFGGVAVGGNIRAVGGGPAGFLEPLVSNDNDIGGKRQSLMWEKKKPRQ